MIRTSQGQLQWALTYPLPISLPALTLYPYVYFAPFASAVPAGLRDVVERGRCWWSGQPLPLKHILTCRLVPASPPARLQCALDAFQEQGISQDAPMIWGTLDRDEGVCIAWYAACHLWGATSYTTREGRRGSIFARSLETLVARELAQGMLPRPDLAADPIRQQFGMQSITPVLLPPATLTPLAACLCQLAVQAVAEKSPHFFATPGQLPEWLVSVLYEERLLVVTHPGSEFPSLEVVIWRLLVLRQQLAASPNEQIWEQTWGEEQDPYAVCQRRLREFEALLGEQALAMVEQAFLKTLLEHQLPSSIGKEEQRV